MGKLVKNNKLWLMIFIALSAVFPFVVGQSGYYMTVFVMFIVYAITAMSLDFLIGYGGQISVGHAGFLMIGSYTVVLMTIHFNIPFFMALLLAGIVSGIVGFIIGLPAVRLSGQFLAVVTLGFGLSVPQVILYFDDLTGGYSGLSIQRPSWLSNKLVLFYMIVIITLIIIYMLHHMIHSRLGRAIVSIRESEVAAQATGINVSLYKTIMFAISAFFTGIAGGLYAYWIGFVSPNDFTVVTSFLVLGMIVVGGLASIPGAIIGAIIFTILPELTSSFIGLTNLIIGLAILVIILFWPTGIISSLRIFINRFNPDEKQVEKEEGGKKEHVGN